MLWLYRLLFFPVLLVLAPAYLARMRRRGGYGENFSQRFGAGHRLPPKTPGVKRIWLQAVSVGEMLAIGPLLEELGRVPAVEVYLTTTTSTGCKVARERYAARTIGIGYFPLDWWPCSRTAWRAIAPDLVILTEGERWPEHIHQACLRHVPVIGVNARLSDRSFRRMRRFSWAVQPLLGGMTRILAGSKHDEERFLALGFARETVSTTGNMKLDVPIAVLPDAERARLRQELGLRDGLVLLGSSTWPGEEAVLLEAWREVIAAGIRCSLLLVPRHAERRAEIERWLAATGVTAHFRSRGPATAPVDVVVGDTTGELQKFTQLADVVFVGKSLPPNEGGQTPVEAAALRKPILLGPAMSNFRPIVRDLLARGAAVEVSEPAALRREILDLLRRPDRRSQIAAAAGEWHAANAGAVIRTVAAIRGELERSA